MSIKLVGEAEGLRKEYRATAQRRREEKRQAETDRRWRAWLVAKQAADLLKQEFSATRVLLFGSLAHAHWFTASSDIDLAATGIDKADFFTAVARLQDLSPEFRIDLVDLEHCPSGLQAAIHAEGQAL